MKKYKSVCSLITVLTASHLCLIPAAFGYDFDIDMVRENCVVTVVGYDSHNNPISSGTGFFVDKGYVVTNWHVLQGTKASTVRFSDGRQSVVRFITYWVEEDLALLEVDFPDNPPYALPLTSIHPRTGDDVIVIGSPLGLESSVSEGIVSAADRTINALPMIQITAPISPGSSGSPVLNESCEVIQAVPQPDTESTFRPSHLLD